MTDFLSIILIHSLMAAFCVLVLKAAVAEPLLLLQQIFYFCEDLLAKKFFL